MNPRTKNIILWLGVIIFIAGVIGFNAYKNNPAPLLEKVVLDKNGSGQATLPFQSPLQKILGLIPHKNQAMAVKTYKNSEYEFEFTYPAGFGEVRIKNYECLPGFMTVGSFSNNPNIDFGFSTNDYQKCQDFGSLLFAIRTYDLMDKKLKLYSSDPDLLSFEVVIEQTIPTPVPNITAYIIKNTIDSDGNGDPAAILRSPNPGIGSLVFRTHLLSYQDGVKLLEAIIK